MKDGRSHGQVPRGFRITSGGKLLFLIGVAFLLIPLFVPKAETGAVIANPASVDTQDQMAGAAQSPGEVRALILPQTAEAQEAEPNDTIDKANQFAIGWLKAFREDFFPSLM